MGAHMKTTIEISDAVLAEARRVARRERTTLRALVEEGLRRTLAERRAAKPGRFRLGKASVRGKGLNPDLDEAPWERILDLSYEGRGT
jgi:Arc/MetJ family transcription regulator